MLMNIIKTEGLYSDNPILNTDSYKIGHWMFMEDNTERGEAYAAARPGGTMDETIVFGPQYILATQMIKPITRFHIEQAAEFLEVHGLPFNRAGWEFILNEHGGHLPISIKCVAEGTLVPVGKALLCVSSTDRRFNAAWAVTYIEAPIQRMWYPTAIATKSFKMKKLSLEFAYTGGVPNVVDFGSRGTTCKEQAMIGGGAHDLSYDTTDNLMGITMLMDYYPSGVDDVKMKKIPGYSIMATEHTVTIGWKESRERAFYENIVRNILPKFGVCAVVIDTYNPFVAIKMFGDLKEEIEKNGTIVLRPDSGDPVKMVLAVLDAAKETFGGEPNTEGFFELPPYIRVIQGDGIDYKVMRDILVAMVAAGYSANNLDFGSGGGLLQKVTRDDLRFNMKGSYIEVGGECRDTRKNPSTDPTKASMAGILDTVYNKETGEYMTVDVRHDPLLGFETCMTEIFRNGELLVVHSWIDVVNRVRAQLPEVA